MLIQTMMRMRPDNGGEGDGGAAEPEVTETSVPQETPAVEPEAPAPLKFSDMVPETFREKPYIQELAKHEKPLEQLFVQFDGLQKKLGERGVTLPSPDAPKEQWDEFYKAARPSTPDDYEIPLLDLGPEKAELANQINGSRDETYLNQMKIAFHEAGLTKEQARILAKSHDSAMVPIFEGMEAAKAAQFAEVDRHFDEVSSRYFGGDRDKAMQFGREFLDKHGSDRLTQILRELPTDKMPAEALLAIAELGVNVHKTYLKEDGFSTKHSPNQGARTVSDLEAEMRDLMLKPGYRDQMANDHTVIRDKVKALSSDIARLQKG